MGGTPERNTLSPTGLATWPWAGGSVLGLLKFGECPGQSARRQRTGTISTPAPLQPQSWIQSTDGIAESWWFFEAFFFFFLRLFKNFTFCCTGSSSLHAGFLWSQPSGATVYSGAHA